MKKFIIYIMIYLLTSAFTFNYKINIAESGNVTETIEFINSQEDINKGLNSTTALLNIKQNLRDYDVQNVDYNPHHIIATKQFTSLGTFRYSDAVSSFLIFTTVDKTKIVFETNYEAIKYVLDERDGYSGDIYTNMNLYITLPYIVSNSNADDKEGETYIWYLTSNEKDEIVIEYNSRTLERNKAQEAALSKSLSIFGIILAIAIVVFAVITYIKFKNRNAGI